VISHPRMKGGDWEITLHDEEMVPKEFITLQTVKNIDAMKYITFIDDSGTEVTYMAEDIDNIIQALTDLKQYL